MKENIPYSTIIIVNYNGERYLQPLFSSLESLNYPKDKLEIIMVDNGSDDSSLELTRGYFKKVKVVQSRLNNYCHANNIGIKLAKGKLIALINNDLTLDEEWLMELVKVLDSDSGIGAVSGKILFPDGKLQSTGHYESPNFYWSDRGFKEDDHGQYDEIAEVPSISHCAALYRRDCLKDTGLLDEDFNMYLEDVDMCIRAKNKGWRLKYAPKSIAYHNFHGTSKENLISFYCERNRLFLIAKHYPLKLAEALYGKGYFASLNNCKDLEVMFSSLLTKLIKHHSFELAMSMWPEIFSSLTKIINFEKDQLIQQLDAKDNEVAKLNALIIQKNEDIESLKREIKQVYNSRAYRFIARPISRIFKRIK